MDFWLNNRSTISSLLVFLRFWKLEVTMNKKVLFAISFCVLIVVVTTIVMVQIVVIRHEMKAKVDQELSLNGSLLAVAEHSTEIFDIEPRLDTEVSLDEVSLDTTEVQPTETSMEDDSTKIMGASIDVPFTPFIVIDAPVPCKKGYKYVAVKKKCERAF